MEAHGTSSKPMEHHQSPWNIIEAHGTSSKPMESYGTLQNIGESSGCLPMLTNDDIYQCI
jgi:hypothetical protein